MRRKRLVEPAPSKTCGGKRCYPTKRDAETAAREQEMLQFHEDLSLNVYRCPYCGTWHLTRRRVK